MNMDKDKTDISEHLYVPTSSKLFLAGVAAWLIGNKVQMKVKGTQSEMRQFTAALIASKKFQNELSKTDSSAESVIDKLHAKNAAARDFKEMTGLDWPM